MPSYPLDDSTPATTRSQTGARPPDSSNSYRESTLGVFALLLGFRAANALTLRTFFQPDEFFQSLEPAWQLAFGRASNAWITWEWRTQLRSSLHPRIFAGVYLAAEELAALCGWAPISQADVLIAAPRVTQAVFAALLDYYTWRLAQSVHGRGSRSAYAALALSVCSPWQWFCSTRTLSNCLETTLSSIAVCYWPWHWPGSAERDRTSSDGGSKQIADQDVLGNVSQLRLSLLLAACACILRPTNALIWLPLSIPTLWEASTRQRYLLIREVLFCGIYYQAWTLPPLRFLYFNVAQSLASFYGRNRPDYYLTEGLPLLLTTALPFALVGSWQALRGTPEPATSSPSGHEAAEQAPSSPLKPAVDSKPSSSGAGHNVKQCPTHTAEAALSGRILQRLAWANLIVTLALSLISHKEVRFLYPVLPFLHVLASGPLSAFFPSPLTPSRKAVLTCLLAVNLLLAGYVSQVHQRGVLDVLSYLRHKHTARTSGDADAVTSVAFLMPCHSTPWRSHLVHPGIDAWALTCEPPLDIPLAQRDTYLDEADQFYAGPAAWIRDHMQDASTIVRSGSRSAMHWAILDPTLERQKKGKRAWPQELVFFQQLEPTMTEVLHGTRYVECWRGFNSHFHDDWRRVGDVVVWCLDG